MRGRRLFLPLQETLLTDLSHAVRWTWSLRVPVGRLVSPGRDSVMAVRCVIAFVVAACFSRAIRLPAVRVFDARWAGGTAGRAMCSPRWELSLPGLRAEHLYRVRGAACAGGDARGARSRVLRRRGGEGEASDRDEGDGGQVEEERASGGDDVVEVCTEGFAGGGVDCSRYAVAGDGVDGGGLDERECGGGGARLCVVGGSSGGRGL